MNKHYEGEMMEPEKYDPMKADREALGVILGIFILIIVVMGIYGYVAFSHPRERTLEELIK